MDSSESPVHGQQSRAQPITATSNASASHPLFLFNQFGDCEGAKLRSRQRSNSADDWQEVLDPVDGAVILQHSVRLAVSRWHAAFAKPEIYEYLETRQIDYAIRLPANEVLQRKIAHLLTRPTEGPVPKAHRSTGSRFHLPEPMSLECIPKGGGQGGVAPGRTVSQSGLS